MMGPAPMPSLSLLADRRRRLLEGLGDGVAVVPAGSELFRSRDTEVAYRQSSDLAYLTGFPEPEAVAVISPHEEAGPLTLFVRPRAPEREAWAGSRHGLEGAKERFGADAVHSIEALDEKLPDLLRPADRVHFPIGGPDDLERMVLEILVSARKTRPRAGVGPTGIEDLDVLTSRLRLIKDSEELDRMRTAARIGAAGHLAAMRLARPGVGEWELRAALEAEFVALGGDAAFLSIVGSGSNATILHYVENTRRTKEDDYVLIDAGAEWGMYCSDITRTFPVSGRFVGPRADLYDVVLAAREAAIAAVRPGAPVSATHDAAVRVLVQGMLDFGLLAGDIDGVIESGDFKRFYLHQTSHWLGLDVHDAGPYRQGDEPIPLAPGMVLTVEPGLYVPADATDVPDVLRGLGIRIEDDVVVTAEGHEILTNMVPVERDEIEAVMRG